MSATIDDQLLELLELAKADRPVWDVLPHQVPPEDAWFFWLMEMGRGTGKTAAAAHYVQDHLNGPPCISAKLPHRVLLVAPTIGDGIESASLNDQALTRLEPGAKLTSSGGGSRVDWPNKSQVRIIGTSTAKDVDRLRAAGNTCLVWAEELAAWPRLQEAWDIFMFGLRKGPQPRVLASTTPKVRPEYIAIRETADHITHGTLRDNPHLNDEQKARLIERYEGTSIGEQELEGKLIEQADGALWSWSLINDNRLPNLLTDWYAAQAQTDLALPPPWARTVVAVDPPGGATEAGIVVAAAIPDCQCGTGIMPHYCVLHDASGKLSPEAWGARTVEAFHAWGADRVLGEKNYGGDMVKAIIRNADRSVPYDDVTATRGKRVRAEPIKGLYEQGRVHHIGTFPELESEQVQWVPDESPWSPNRLDAVVWAITYLSNVGSTWWSA